MLAKFRVSNYKNFKDEFTFDLSHAGKYEFNSQCVESGLVKKALVYGPNGVGKSNLGYALFDIVSHLTEYVQEQNADNFYLNAYSNKATARFCYEFRFGEDTVVYSYGKTNKTVLISESLSINSVEVLSIDRDISTVASFGLKGAESLKADMGDSHISIVNYVRNNAVLDVDPINNCFFKFLKFVEGMLFYRSLQKNQYIGLESGNNTITTDIIDHGNLKDFESFLNEAGVKCKLASINNDKDIAFDFDGILIPFYSVASTGTQALALYYYWLQRLRENSGCTFLFVDEYDAFYHHGLSMLLAKKLRELNVQVILTTHNTSIMTNELLRPDCYFLMDRNKAHSLSSMTNKDLRSAHNIEKMYRAGSFNV